MKTKLVVLFALSYCAIAVAEAMELINPEDVQIPLDKEGAYDIGRQLARKYVLTGASAGAVRVLG